MTDQELDVLVAEKVMGWHISLGPDWEGDWLDSSGERVEYGPTSFTGLKGWSPSTAIAEAWTVVETLRLRGIFLHLMCDEETWQVSTANCENVPLNGDWSKDGYGASENAPRAVCLAALKVVGVESPQEAAR